MQGREFVQAPRWCEAPDVGTIHAQSSLQLTPE